MRHRLGVLIGSLVASGTLAVALVAAGFAPGTGPATSPLASSAAGVPPTQVDTVYVPAPLPPTTITVHRTVRSGGEHESESGGDG